MTPLMALIISGTLIDIAPTDEAGAVAVVTMVNHYQNGPQDTGAYALTYDGAVFGVSFEWDHGPHGEDRMTITPPAGFTCIPVDCAATVVEGQTGRVLILPWVGS